MNSYLKPGTNQGNNKGAAPNYLNTYSGTGQNERYIEKYGPHRGNFKVFHSDGSFADLPDQHVEGGGANAGATTK